MAAATCVISDGGPGRRHKPPPGTRPGTCDDRRVGRAIQDVQRVAAYGIVQRAHQVLLVRLTDLTPAPGAWSLPGGGIEHGEHPAAAVVRELYEETGLAGRVVELLDVDSQVRENLIDQEVLERYHAVRILYRLEVDEDRPLQVIDIQGSSDAPTWHDTADLDGLRLTPIARLARQYLSH